MTITGNDIHDLAKALWPINRSLTGDGVRQTLDLLKTVCPGIVVHEVPSGTRVFDWTIPREWNVKEAYLVDPDGNRIADFAENNLHLVGYSVPVDREVEWEELDAHLYSLPDQPDAIPYITSYYAERWGFCLADEQRKRMKKGRYRVRIDSTLADGYLTYGELVLPGRSDREIFLSTYLCHPSMANNEISGMAVTTYLAKWLASLDDRAFTYRIVFIPETIGSITYLSRHHEHLKRHVHAGFNVSCVGDDRGYSYLPSRAEQTISDHVARHVLRWTDGNYRTYSWSDRGSDERQYCAPGIDLPIASMMRTKYGQYPEYHTSLDDLVRVVTPEGLQGGYACLRRALEVFEKNCYPQVTVLGEPQLGKRGLYPTLSAKSSADAVLVMMDLITYSDGTRSLLEIAEKCAVPVWDLYPILDRLADHQLVVRHPARQAA